MKKRMRHMLVLASVMIMVVGMFSMTAQSEKVTLRFMTVFSGAQGEIEDGWLRLFEASHPEISIKRIRVAGVMLDYAQKLFAMIAGGRAPDISSIDGWFTERFFERGVALQIDPYIERDNVDLSNLREAFKDYATSPIDGKMYGLPWGTGFNLLFYNMDLFEEAGLPYPEKGWTMADFKEYAKKLTQDKNNDGVMDQWGIRYLFDAQALLNANGGVFINRGDPPTAGFTDPRYIEMMDWTAALMLEDHSMATQSQQQGIGGGQVEITGRFGMWSVPSSFGVPTYKAMNLGEKFRWTTTYWPKGEAGIPSWAMGNVMAIMAQSKHPEEAWEFLKWTLSEEADLYLARNLLYPKTKAGAHLPEFISPPGLEPDVLLPAAYPTDFIVESPVDVPSWSEVYWNVYRSQIDRVWSGEMTATEAMEEIVDAANKVLADAWTTRMETRDLLEQVGE